MPEPQPAVSPRKEPAKGALARFLDLIERAGNALPHPATLFVIMGGVTLVASYLSAHFGVSAVHPKDGSTLAAVNLLDREGLRRVFTEAVRNFMGFAPLGTVLVAMLGIGVAEGTGLVSVGLRAFVMRMPRKLLTATVVFAGVNANLAADAGIIVLPPLAAMLFVAAGRHPLAGIAAAFAGVAGGFSANLLPTPLSVLLTGLSQAALDASRLLPGYEVQILGNYFFMAASVPVLTVAGIWVTERIIEPRLGKWEGSSASAGAATVHAGSDGVLAPPTPRESRALRAALLAAFATLAVIAVFALAPWGPLRVEGANELQRLKPLFDSIVVVITLMFLIPGIVYGVVAGGIRSDHDVARLTSDTMATMGTYIVIAFAASQFVSWFGWSNLGAILSIKGAAALRTLGLQDAPLLVGFVIFSATINLLITSSSAAWAILAPVFVPMFVLLGFTPEGTQAVYRVGESSTNIITPLMPYLPFVLASTHRYAPRAGIGTLISLMLPYAAAFLLLWTLLLLAYVFFGWPIGPGVWLRLPQGA
ncbi:MAG: AbgT family transporter [Candidatus Eisenbacteria bacterium]